MPNTTVDLPADLLDLLSASRLVTELDSEPIRVALAMFLFVTERVSIGRAAELSRLPYVDFRERLIEVGLPTVFYGEEEHREDLATIERLRRPRDG